MILRPPEEIDRPVEVRIVVFAQIEVLHVLDEIVELPIHLAHLLR